MLAFAELYPIERTLVMTPDEISAPERRHRVPSLGVIFSEHRACACFRENDCLPCITIATLKLDVVELGIHCERDVGDKRPRSRRPHEDATPTISGSPLPACRC